ncbi:MAG: SRPBCC domain-containing protein [Candidatus Binataceae bacterium]
MATDTVSEPADRVVVITRVFDAPRSLVFKAWTQPDHLKRWWGPRGHTTVSARMDLRAGGPWRIGMRAPDGTYEWQQGVFREIVEQERLVFTYAFEDAAGKPGHETIVTVTFADEGGKTRLTVHQAVFETVAVHNDHVRGWGEALDRLAEYTASV